VFEEGLQYTVNRKGVRPTVSDPPTQAEVQSLRGKAEKLADDVKALEVLTHALGAALLAMELGKAGV
jgi:hypothetical protein